MERSFESMKVWMALRRNDPHFVQATKKDRRL
jgi:hypothetical protein